MAIINVVFSLVMIVFVIPVVFVISIVRIIADGAHRDH